MKKYILLVFALAFTGCQNCCSDGWVFTTKDGTFMCHFTHTVEKINSKNGNE